MAKESRIRLLLCLSVVGTITLVQSLPTHREARSVIGDLDLPRRVFWSNVSYDVSVPYVSLDEWDRIRADVESSVRLARRSDTQCRPTLPLEPTLPRDLSLCPWSYHTEDEDPDRFPVIIPQAYCQCSRCHFSRLINFQAIAELPGIRSTSACKEVYENRRVLRRAVPGDETSPYVPYDVPVSVACVCQKHIS
ncbi:uncharacterized protein LOC135157218 [Lytechinus pictus]|uniref:uncharacterized protein LOC135157218 n=1 Tax=Lytechinus pictus TaxID=7653 RepID=UPI0030BA1E4C